MSEVKTNTLNGKITSIRVNYGQTINMGNYESLRLDFGAEYTLAPDEGVPETFKKIREGLRNQLIKAVKEEQELWR